MEKLRQLFREADLPLPEDKPLSEEPATQQMPEYLPTRDPNRFIKIHKDIDIPDNVKEAILQLGTNFRNTYRAKERHEYYRDALRRVYDIYSQFGIYNRSNREVINVYPVTQEFDIDDLKQDLGTLYPTVVESESHRLTFDTSPHGFLNEQGQPVATAQDVFVAAKAMLTERGVPKDVVDMTVKLESTPRVKHNQLRELEKQGFVELSEGTRKTRLAVALQSANTVNIPENLQTPPKRTN